jgi:hypothetical protein
MVKKKAEIATGVIENRYKPHPANQLEIISGISLIWHEMQ